MGLILLNLLEEKERPELKQRQKLKELKNDEPIEIKKIEKDIKTTILPGPGEIYPEY